MRERSLRCRAPQRYREIIGRPRNTEACARREVSRTVMFPLHRDRLKALWHIMAWVIDQCTHRVGHEFLTRIRT
jgi:hypothetical protein